MESNTKTIAKRARVERGLGSDMIVLDNVLKLWMELIKQRNDNATKKFYRFRVVWKVQLFIEISKISKNLEISRISSTGAPALRVIRAGTRLTVHRSLAYRTAVNWRHPGPAKIHDNGQCFQGFRNLLYQELLVCYIKRFYIVLKLNFLRFSALELDQTFVLNWPISFPKC